MRAQNPSGKKETETEKERNFLVSINSSSQKNEDTNEEVQPEIKCHIMTFQATYLLYIRHQSNNNSTTLLLMSNESPTDGQSIVK